MFRGTHLAPAEIKCDRQTDGRVKKKSQIFWFCHKCKSQQFYLPYTQHKGQLQKSFLIFIKNSIFWCQKPTFYQLIKFLNSNIYFLIVIRFYGRLEFLISIKYFNMKKMLVILTSERIFVIKNSSFWYRKRISDWKKKSLNIRIS